VYCRLEPEWEYNRGRPINFSRLDPLDSATCTFRLLIEHTSVKSSYVLHVWNSAVNLTYYQYIVYMAQLRQMWSVLIQLSEST
jgi:hypothetical protein